MSHFFYIHRCLAGTPDVWKVGVTKTPYSAVRARQKFTWARFSLDYLYFGRPDDVLYLEQCIKDIFFEYSGKYQVGYGTELLQVKLPELLAEIKTIIKEDKLDIVFVDIDVPYHATSSKLCPFGIPPEKDCDKWLKDKEREVFKSTGSSPNIKRIFARNNFHDLYY